MKLSESGARAHQAKVTKKQSLMLKCGARAPVLGGKRRDLGDDVSLREHEKDMEAEGL